MMDGEFGNSEDNNVIKFRLAARFDCSNLFGHDLCYSKLQSTAKNPSQSIKYFLKDECTSGTVEPKSKVRSDDEG